MNKIVVACFAALLSVAAFGARAISAFSVETGENGNTVFNLTFDAGNAGDSHALYYAWSNDGKDYGEDPAGWPNVLRVGRVADDATEFSFEMPEGKATITPLYAARAFLAKSEVAYDYLIESLYVSKTQKCYLDTGFKPQGGKTAVTMDLKLYYSGLDADQTYVFGSNAGLSFCAYINSAGCWAFSCDDGSGSWTNPTTLEAKKERVRVTVDSKIPEAVFTVEGETGSASDTTTEIHDNTATVNLYLFGRSGTKGNDKDCALTFYSCSITNDGVCVRDYRPCVKDGVVGIYDSANNTFSTSSGTTAFSSPGANATYFVNSGDETVGSAIWKFASSDLSINEPYVENNNLSFEGGAMKSGPAPLTLAGLNDFGGLFTVADGTLVADFGRGLAETDRLVLDGGTYCPLSSETLNVSFDAENPKISIPSRHRAASRRTGILFR